MAWPASTWADERAASSLAAHIERVALEPKRFVIEQFRHADLVLLGEDHGVREVLNFVHDLIPALHAHGVFHIGMEFGAEEQQARVDAVLQASRYDEQAVRDALWDYNVGWAYTEYQDVIRAAWSFNRQLPLGQTPMRVINLSYRYDWQKFTRRDDPVGMSRVFHRGGPDHFRAERVAQETLATGQKMLLLVGLPHAFSAFRPGSFDALARDFCRYETQWLGQQLAQRAPGRVRTVLFHQPWPGHDGRAVLPAGGALDLALAKLGHRPCGFALNASGIGSLADRSALARCHERLSLADVADGYVYLAPLHALTGCQVDPHFFEGHPWSETRIRLPDPDWHGTIASQAVWEAKVRAFVDIPARYASVLPRLPTSSSA